MSDGKIHASVVLSAYLSAEDVLALNKYQENIIAWARADEASEILAIVDRLQPDADDVLDAIRDRRAHHEKS